MAGRRRETRTPRASSEAGREERRAAPDVLNVEVTLAPRPDGLAVVHSSERPALDNVGRFRVTSAQSLPAANALAELGLEVTAMGAASISAKCPAATYRRLFSTQLDVFRQPVGPAPVVRPSDSAAERLAGPVQEFLFPPDGAGWDLPLALSGLVEEVYIQWPPIYFESPIPPFGIGYHHLRVPGDVTYLLSADAVHRAGTTGKGIKVAMVDSGFYTQHPYFLGRGYTMSVVLAPGATHADQDGNGHGTAECANLLAIAPDVTFIGVKLDNETNPNLGASLAEGFKTAVAQRPHVITVSLGFDLVAGMTRNHLTVLPNSLRALEAEVKAAVAAGIIVVFAAGNGHVAFPGMMPEVLAAGGTYVDAKQQRQASDYASAFASRIYPGRHVPDVTGLVGLVATAGAYIMLPVQPGCEIDTDVSGGSFPDGTQRNDGWCVISGTSAAAPQLAGVCALLKQKNPALTPLEAVNVLARTARDVRTGRANAASSQNVALRAGPGPDGATGHGLVDAFAAWRQV